jgi:hypothetical protein
VLASCKITAECANKRSGESTFSDLSALILGGPVAKRLKELLYEKAAELDTTIDALESMPDDVHMFVESDPTLAPAHIAAQFKGFSSRILREKFPFLKSRLPSPSCYEARFGTRSPSSCRQGCSSASPTPAAAHCLYIHFSRWPPPPRVLCPGCGRQAAHE